MHRAVYGIQVSPNLRWAMWHGFPFFPYYDRLVLNTVSPSCRHSLSTCVSRQLRRSVSGLRLCICQCTHMRMKLSHRCCCIFFLFLALIQAYATCVCDVILSLFRLFFASLRRSSFSFFLLRFFFISFDLLRILSFTRSIAASIVSIHRIVYEFALFTFVPIFCPEMSLVRKAKREKTGKQKKPSEVCIA